MEETEEDFEGYDIEKVLEELNAKYFVVDKLEGSDYDGYIGVYLENIEIENILIEYGFEKIKNDFFLIRLDQAKLIPENELKRIKLNNCENLQIEKYSAMSGKRLQDVSEIWNKLIDRYLAINKYFKYYGIHKEYYFNPSERVLERSYKLPLLLVKDENSLGEFCYYLYQLTFECIKDEIKMDVGYKINEKFGLGGKSKKEIKKLIYDLLGEDNFYNDIEALRHYFIHLYYEDENNKKDYSPEAHEEVLIKCLQKRMLNKLTNDYEYYHLQVDILNDCYKYLTKLHEIITTKEIV